MPVTVGPNGPLFGLAPLVDAIGGEITSDESGESVTLRIVDRDVVIGPGNAIITVGDSIVSLSQPPVGGEGGLQVPVDFLKKTYGDILGYAFEWHPETSAADHRPARRPRDLRCRSTWSTSRGRRRWCSSSRRSPATRSTAGSREPWWWR